MGERNPLYLEHAQRLSAPTASTLHDSSNQFWLQRAQLEPNTQSRVTNYSHVRVTATSWTRSNFRRVQLTTWLSLLRKAPLHSLFRLRLVATHHHQLIE